MEALLNNLGTGGTLIRKFDSSCNSTECEGLFPGGYWPQLGYGSIILLFCLIVCLVGAGNLLLDIK